jgi:subtilase family serine protease
MTIGEQTFTVTQSAVQNAPDLTGLWTTPLTQACTTIGKNQRCTLKGVFTVNNIGDKDASSTFVNFYLSDNNTFEGGDTPLKSFTTGKLKAGKNKLIRFNYSLSAGQSAAGKYIIAVIDKDNQVTEMNEANNTVVHGPIQ